VKDLTAQDVAQEERLVSRIHSGPFGWVETTDQSEVFEGNGRLNPVHIEKELASWFCWCDLGCGLRQRRVGTFARRTLRFRLGIGLPLGRFVRRTTFLRGRCLEMAATLWFRDNRRRAFTLRNCWARNV